MKPAVSPLDEALIRAAFEGAVNMSPEALETWLETPESLSVGQVRRGERESVGHKAGRRIVEILRTPAAELSETDHALMRKAVGYIRRHLAQRPDRDVTTMRWRYALMNWGHDPMRS